MNTQTDNSVISIMFLHTTLFVLLILLLHHHLSHATSHSTRTVFKYRP